MTELHACGYPLENVFPLEYLGLLLTVKEYDWPEVIVNLYNACKPCFRLSRILGWEGAGDQTLGLFYLTMVKDILLFCADNWVVILHIGNILGGFHHVVTQRISGKHTWLLDYRSWK